ncbi:MAG: hypothetical protein N2037_06850, partial [Acidimicrobiales bacterium]|nr:hypothetical protein [Acidimicrobiales bacterium]
MSSNLESDLEVPANPDETGHANALADSGITSDDQGDPDLDAHDQTKAAGHGRADRDLPHGIRAEPRRLSRRERIVHFCRRHRLLTGTAILLFPFVVLLTYSWVQAMTKPGAESFLARNVQWLRDVHMGWLVDRIEQKYYEHEQPPDGGTPDQAITPIGSESERREPASSSNNEAPNAPPQTLPHLTPPSRLPTPASDPLPNEGEWFPAGPELPGGLHGVYTTKVRPNAQKTSLLVFVAWIDPKLTTVKIHPGTELPGGK